MKPSPHDSQGFGSRLASPFALPCSLCGRSSEMSRSRRPDNPWGKGEDWIGERPLIISPYATRESCSDVHGHSLVLRCSDISRLSVLSQWFIGIQSIQEKTPNTENLLQKPRLRRACKHSSDIIDPVPECRNKPHIIRREHAAKGELTKKPHAVVLWQDDQVHSRITH